MSQKSKILQQTLLDRLATVTWQAGMLLMAAAAVFGILELPDHQDRRNIVLPAQASLAFATVDNGQGSNPLRREREETAPHYISYAVAQRTPGRTSR